MFKKEYTILLLVIAALTVYLFVLKKDKTHYKLPAIQLIEKNDVSKITIKQVNAEIQLRKEEKNWFIMPGNYPADRGLVEKMLDDIKGLTLTALASESKNYTLYELNEENKITVEAFKGDTSIRKFDIGKPAPSYRHTFIKLEDDHRIFHAIKNLRGTFDKTVQDLRDRIVMKFEDDITELTLIEDNRELNITKKTAPVSAEPGNEQENVQKPESPWETDKGQTVKGQEVDEIINTLSSLSCDGFIEEKSKADYNSPIYTVSLKGSKTYTVSLFAPEDSKYPATSSENEYPFFVSEWKAKKITKKFSDLIESGEQ
jgi:hypothetical protein